MEPIITLRDNLANLSESDQRFASSLLASRTLSAKQHHWIAVLAERAITPKAAPASVGDISATVAFLQRAKAKFPALRIRLSGDRVIRLNVAGEKAREPGSLTVTSEDRDTEGRRIWLGRVSADGVFHPSNACNFGYSDAGEALRPFLADPVKAVREYGRRTGYCVFCNSQLDGKDGVSNLLGYGPTCARKWNLPHGKKALECEGVAA